MRLRLDGRVRRALFLSLDRLEPRSLLAAGWSSYAKNAQHTALSDVASQDLQVIRWSTPVDEAPQYSGQYLLIHYGSPLVTSAGTVIVPVKADGSDYQYELQGRHLADGGLKWEIASDYTLPPHDWVPPYSPTLAGGRLYAPAEGGTVLYTNTPDTSGAVADGRLAFYVDVDQHAALRSTVFISTPLTADAAGNLYFGFVVTGPNALGLESGIARIGADGSHAWVAARAAAGDDAIAEVAQNCAPALSNDGKSLYVAVSTGNRGRGYLLKLDAATLATEGKAALVDPHSQADAALFDSGTATPMIGPDGDVYYGVLENPGGSNHFRGWLLHFSGDLATLKTPGAFGWDDTPSVVPASMVPSYTGSSAYLLMAKYNNYAGAGGDGVNKIAVLDPNTAMVDPVTGAHVMNEVLTIAGPTPDDDFRPAHPNAVREWCINTAVVDPTNGCILANCEDGVLYRWDLATNSFTQQMRLTSGLGEAYTPTLIAPDGTVFAINNATLFAVGASNVAPRTLPDEFSTTEDGALKVPAPGVLANDRDDQGDPILAAVVTPPAHGRLELDSNGAFRYFPNLMFYGTDEFSYRATDGLLWSAATHVRITVTHRNHAPLGQADLQLNTFGSTLRVAAPGVLGNDQDPDGDTIMVVLASAPPHGSIVLAPDGSYVYTPNPGFVGDDSFTYRLIDGELVSTPVTATITTLVDLNGRIAAQDDTGRSDSDGITQNNQPAIVGSAPAGFLVQLIRDTSSGPQILADTRADDASRFRFEGVALPEGTSLLRLLATGESNAPILEKALGSVIVDTSGPRVEALVFDKTRGLLLITFSDGSGGFDDSALLKPTAYSVGRMTGKRVTPVRLLGVSQQSTASSTRRVVALRLDGARSLGRARLKVRLVASLMRDAAGNALDGEYRGRWPSGDGRAGGDFQATLDLATRRVTIAKR